MSRTRLSDRKCILFESGNKSMSHVEVPPGVPSWITVDLIVDTIQTWQPHYRGVLTAMDAVEILMNTARLFGALEITA